MKSIYSIWEQFQIPISRKNLQIRPYWFCTVKASQIVVLRRQKLNTKIFLQLVRNLHWKKYSPRKNYINFTKPFLHIFLKNWWKNSLKWIHFTTFRTVPDRHSPPIEYFNLLFFSFTADLLPHFSDNEIKVKNLQRTTLTGNSKLSDLTKSFKDLNNWMFQPMRLATFKLNFFDW